MDDLMLALAGAAALGAGVYYVAKPGTGTTGPVKPPGPTVCNVAAIVASAGSFSAGTATAQDVANMNTLTAACANTMSPAVRTLLLGQLATYLARIPGLTTPAVPGAMAAVNSAITTLGGGASPGQPAPPTGAGRPMFRRGAAGLGW